MCPILLTLLLTALCVTEGTKVPSAVIELNDRFLDVHKEGFWLVKLYAPWCAHCKRLAPVWEHVGHALADKNKNVKVGKVDCTRFPGVAQKLKVSGYPTILFFRNGVNIPYEGERTKDALVNFALKSAGPVVQHLSSVSEFRTAASADKVLFLFVGGLDHTLWKSFEEVAGLLFTQTKFYRTDTVKTLPPNVVLDHRPTVVVFKDGTTIEFGADSGLSLSQWVREERWSTVEAISASNIHEISEDTGKKLVLAVLDPVDKLDPTSQTASAFKTLTESAKKVKNDDTLKTHFQFGWLEGTDIANSVTMSRLALPNLLVLNLSSYEFYLSDDQFNSMTVDSLVTFLKTVVSGHTKPQGGRSWTQRIRRMAFEFVTNVSDMFYHQPILTTCLFGVPIAFFTIITYSLCSSDFSVDRDEIYTDVDSDEEDDEKRMQYREGEDEYSETEAGWFPNARINPHPAITEHQKED